MLETDIPSGRENNICINKSKISTTSPTGISKAYLSFILSQEGLLKRSFLLLAELVNWRSCCWLELWRFAVQTNYSNLLEGKVLPLKENDVLVKFMARRYLHLTKGKSTSAGTHVVPFSLLGKVSHTPFSKFSTNINSKIFFLMKHPSREI